MSQDATPRPNRVITAVSAPVEADLFSSIHLAWTVQNQGSAATERSYWIDSVWFSKDQTIGLDDWYLGQKDIDSQLLPGESYVAALDVQLLHTWLVPPIFFLGGDGSVMGGEVGTGAFFSYSVFLLPGWDRELAGPGYLLFDVDSYSSSGQLPFEEVEKTVAVPFQINAPDLTVTAFSGPSRAFSGQDVDLSWRVANLGPLAIAGHHWNDWYWLGWRDVVVFSINEIFGDADDLPVASIDVDREVLPFQLGDSYAQNWKVVLPARASGSGYLLLKADGEQRRAEWDETNNIASIPLQVDATNLALIAGDAPDVAHAKQSITLSWSVLNTGSVPAAAPSDFVDRIYFSTNKVYGDEDDIYLGQSSLGSGQGSLLAPGDRYQKTVTVELPASVLGPGHLMVHVDDGNHLAETDETDNVLVHPIHILTPDLELLAADAPADIAQASRAVISWTVRNRGASAARGSWHDAIYYSTDAILDDGDVLIGEALPSALAPLEPGGSYTNTQSLRLPTPIVPGPRWLLFVTNPHAEQVDVNRSNNFRAVAINVTSPPLAGVLPVENGSVTGALDATDQPNPTAVECYSDDYALTDLVPGRTVKLELRASFPAVLQLVNADTQAIIHTIIGVYEPVSLIFTPQPGVNYVARASSLWEGLTGAYSLHAIDRFPDLAVTEAAAPEASAVNTTIAVTWTVRNSGEAEANAPWVDGLYLSKDAQWDGSDRPLHIPSSLDHQALAIGASVTRRAMVDLPSLTGGLYHLLIISDRSNIFHEENKDNNVLAIPFHLKAADLLVTAASVPASVDVGDSVPISWTVANRSETSTTTAGWIDRLYLSSDSVLDFSDTLVAEYPRLEEWLLESDQSSSQTHGVTLPNRGPSGAVYLLVVTDEGNLEPELNEENNVFAVPIQLNAPDLVVTSAVAPEQISLGESVALSWRVLNRGQASARALWSDQLVLSEDDIYGNHDDVKLLGTAAVAPLSEMSGYEQAINFIFPACSLYMPFELGRNVLFVQADGNGDQAENDESNNVFSLPITILAPDLQITTASAPPEVIDGQTIALTWHVSNSGSGRASRSWWDRIYLSSDQVINTGDRLVSSRWQENAEPLVAGESVALSMSATLPPFGPGQHYLLFDLDSANDQGESDEHNNLFSLPITIQSPDLIVSRASAPSMGTLGQSLQVSWQVTNQGDFPALATWFDGAYLSIDADLDLTDTFVDRLLLPSPSPLTPGDSYSMSQTIKLPSFNTGASYLLFVADGLMMDDGTGQGESNENNNVLALPIHLDAPDLVVKGIKLPAKIYAGQTIDFDWLLANQGTATADGYWLTSAHMIELKSGHYHPLFIDEAIGFLPAGETLRRSTTYRVPDDLLGDYQVVIHVNYGNSLIEGPNAFNNRWVGDQLISILPGNGGPASFAVSGLALAGHTLQADRTTSDPDGDGRFRYHWATSADGKVWTTVGGDASSYEVREADAGLRLRLDVSYRDGKDFAESVVVDAGTVSLPPLLTLDAATIRHREGNSGVTTYPVTLRRSGDLRGESRVTWTTVGCGADPATSLDFAGGELPGGTVVWAPGQEVVSVDLAVVGDGLLEPDEGFQIVLSSPRGARLSSTASPEILILNDDPPAPTYSFVATPDTVDEGGSVHIAVSTTNVEAWQTLWWQLSGAGVTGTDFSDGQRTGSVLLGVDGRAAFVKSVAVDAVVDPEETVTLRFFSDAARTQPLGSALTLTLKEPSVGVVTDSNDVITGTAAAERLTGVPVGSTARGRGSLDRLTGGGGADLFVLGDAAGIYYNDGTPGLGTTDMALITDFTPGDRIQLPGSNAAYRLVSGRHRGKRGVRLDALSAPPENTAEAIGFVFNATLATLNLTNPNHFLYV